MSYAVKLDTGVQYLLQRWKNFLAMTWALNTNILLWSTNKTFEKWDVLHLENDALLHNKTVESCSSSHSSKLQVA